MAQFDVHALANNKSQLVVNLQHVLFEARPSRLIVPLIPGERRRVRGVGIKDRKIPPARDEAEGATPIAWIVIDTVGW